MILYGNPSIYWQQHLPFVGPFIWMHDSASSPCPTRIGMAKSSSCTEFVLDALQDFQVMKSRTAASQLV